MNKKRNCIGTFNGIGATMYEEFLLSIGFNKKDIKMIIDRSNRNKPYIVIECIVTNEEYKKINNYVITNLKEYCI